MAKAGGSTAYLKVTDGAERSLSRFDVGGETLSKGLKCFIYGERGVWRPGDTLHVTAIVADKNRALPKDHPASLEVYTPQGQFYAKYVRKGTDGFYSFAIPTKEADPTGYWNAYVKVGGSSFHKTLHIETIKPNRLKINTSYPEILQAGEASGHRPPGLRGALPVAITHGRRLRSEKPAEPFSRVLKIIHSTAPQAISQRPSTNSTRDAWMHRATSPYRHSFPAQRPLPVCCRQQYSLPLKNQAETRASQRKLLHTLRTAHTWA